MREAPLHKFVLGVGFTTDSGPRVSVDHINNRLPVIGWRAVSRLSVDRETQSLGTEWNSIPDDRGWRWIGSGLAKRETSGSYEVDSGRLRGGRSQTGDHIDRSYLPAVRLRQEPGHRRAAVGLGHEPELDLDRPLLRRCRAHRSAARAWRWNWAPATR